MAEYIPKSALVAEIERKINAIGIPRDKIEGGVLYELGNLQDFINTLEVKEVEEEPYVMSKTGKFTTTTK